MDTSELYSEHHHWGALQIDITGQDLPALKAGFLIDNLPTTGKVLEVGCGSGKILNTVGPNRPGLELHGCDIRALRAPSDVFQFSQVDPDSDSLPYPPETFDAVLMSDILEHLHDPGAILRAAAEVLKPGGLLVSFAPLEGQRFSFYRGYRKLLGDDLYVKTKEHVQAYSNASLTGLINGPFEIVKQEYAYHLIGHLMDATLFALMKLPRWEKRFWDDNPYYAEEQAAPEARQSLYERALTVANRVAFRESRALRRYGLTSAGTLIVARKRPA